MNAEKERLKLIAEIRHAVSTDSIVTLAGIVEHLIDVIYEPKIEQERMDKIHDDIMDTMNEDDFN